LVVGLGKGAEADGSSVQHAAAATARWIKGKRIGRMPLALPEDVPGLTWSDVALAAGVGLMQGCLGPGLRKSEAARFIPDAIWLVGPPSAPRQIIQEGARRADIE